MKRDLRRILDREDVTPGDVPHWIVEYHNEFDERDMTPLEAVKRAAAEIRTSRHSWTVYHVRSDMQWSVDLGSEEVFETVTVSYPPVPRRDEDKDTK